MAQPDPHDNDHEPPVDRAEFIRRRRGRNWALLLALLGFCLIIYLVSIVRIGNNIMGSP